MRNELELQELLFARAPTRRELAAYVPQTPKAYRVQVFRNHSFELVEHTLGAYLDYAGLGIDFVYGAYDDSFTFTQLDAQADAVVLWADLTRYRAADAAGFLAERAAWLRAHYAGPILLVPCGGKVTPPDGVLAYAPEALQAELGEDFWDRRAQALTGTALSSRALLGVTRELGLRWLPALLRPPLKAVLVDLDNTLYRGVLGEDGPAGLVLTPAHAALQRELKRLAGEGFFLCAVSKNEEEDVAALFRARTDFPLQWQDFTRLAVSWRPKAEAVADLAAYLNIGADSMLFIDDNPGELAAVQAAHPGIRLLRAAEDAAITCRVLCAFPGLYKTAHAAEDALRRQDTQANAERRALQQTLSGAEYLRSLAIRLTFTHNAPAQAPRIAELANKTNQFIFHYARYTQPQIEALMRDAGSCVVAVSMTDRLSDSGLIAVCVGRRRPDFVEVEECFVSCRALGRGIDDVIVLEAIRLLTERLGCRQVKVDFKPGPRNRPAETFARRYLGAYLERPAPFSGIALPEGLDCVYE